MIVIYKSKSEHTKKYARLLAEKMNLECCSLEEISSYEDIIFCGHIVANKIQGLSKLKQTELVCVVDVGLMKEDANMITKLKKNNKVEVPLHYLRGGVDYTRLKGISKLVMKVISKSALKNKEKLSKQEISVFEVGGEFFEEGDLLDVK